MAVEAYGLGTDNQSALHARPTRKLLPVSAFMLHCKCSVNYTHLTNTNWDFVAGPNSLPNALLTTYNKLVGSAPIKGWEPSAVSVHFARLTLACMPMRFLLYKAHFSLHSYCTRLTLACIPTVLGSLSVMLWQAAQVCSSASAPSSSHGSQSYTRAVQQAASTAHCRRRRQVF